jgi:TolA-binding protein
MKRSERHHLKDNDLANLAKNARDVIEDKQGPIAIGLIAILVVLIVGGGFFLWKSRVNGRAQTLLADALVLDDARVGPPAVPGTPEPSGLSFPTARAKYQASLTKFKIVADEYPSSDAGIFARYRQAATFMSLGEPKSAAEAYQQVIDQAGEGLYGQMARLGLAEAQSQTGAFDQAIATFTDLAQRKDGQLPIDGVLAQLARAYLDAGKTGDAQKTYNRIVDEFPQSPFTEDARRALEQMKKG